jgi:hypothetical protein
MVPLIDTSYAAACYGVPVSECFLNPEVHACALVSCLERHPDLDGLSINIGITSEVVRERARTTDGWSITTLDGSVWRVPLNDIGTPVRHDITRFDDERLQSLDILRPHITETLRRIPTAVVARHNISVGLTGPFSQVAFLMGVERVMTAMIEQPDKLKAAIEYRVPFATTWAERLDRRRSGVRQPDLRGAVRQLRVAVRATGHAETARAGCSGRAAHMREVRQPTG